MRFFVLVVVVIFNCRTYIRCGQNREDKRLQKCHKQFNKVHKNSKQAANDTACYGSAYRFPVFAKKEYKTDEAQYDNVPGRYIGKQSYHEREGAQEQTQDFYRRKDDFHPCRDTGHPEYVLPVVFVAVEAHHEKGENRQGERYGQVAGYVGATREKRYQTQQVAEQYKEK